MEIIATTTHFPNPQKWSTSLLGFTLSAPVQTVGCRLQTSESRSGDRQQVVTREDASRAASNPTTVPMIAIVMLAIVRLAIGMILFARFVDSLVDQTVSDATIHLHEARTRLAVAQSKAKVRATLTRLRRELCREMWWTELKEDSVDQ